MLIRPLRPPARTGDAPVPAWQAVQQTMLPSATEECWLITQADHAQLAGDIAGQLSNPHLEAAAVEAIAVHDAGWKLLDRIPPSSDELPVSFFYVRPSDVGRAWLLSVDEAETRSPLAGLMVSGHFFRLASERARAGIDSGEDAAAIQNFLQHESGRQERLGRLAKCPGEEVERLIDALQFCDLLSLYLCCGAEVPAEFPQVVPEAGIVIRSDGDGYRLEPSPMARAIQLSVAAYWFAPNRPAAHERISIRLR
jgi:hypothetical protein